MDRKTDDSIVPAAQESLQQYDWLINEDGAAI